MTVKLYLSSKTIYPKNYQPNSLTYAQFKKVISKKFVFLTVNMPDAELTGDLGVIGAGVGGLGCAIIAAYKGLKVVVFEGGRMGGIVTTLYARKIVENYPGAPSILGKRLIDEFIIQAEEVQARILNERVVNVKQNEKFLTIVTNEGSYNFRSIVIATGSRPAELGIPGERKFRLKDRGVYNFITDPDKFKGKEVLVVGGGDTAIDAVHGLHRIAKKIYLVHRKNKFRGAETKVNLIVEDNMAEIIYNHVVDELKGEKELEEAVLENIETNMRREIKVDKCILAVGMTTNLEIFEDLGILTEGKYIKVDKEMRTSVPGVFAIGDIATQYQLIVIAVAQGAKAAHNAFGMIRKPYWYKEEEWPTFESC
ncbi:MAG: FAD-dependent oxidoreductase [Candidatus Heimdallarchaeota archaeon]|nr:FAD-dependent oxidoreductase [Candidatus Heimdallarchaeota archaeon]